MPSIEDYNQISRSRLMRVSLVAEDPMDTKEAIQLLASILVMKETKRKNILENNFYLVIHILASLGYHFYEAGEFWPHVEREIRAYCEKYKSQLPNQDINIWSQSIQTELGKYFLRGLEIARMPMVNDPDGLKYLSQILFHSGIPAGSTKNFVEAIETNLKYAYSAEELLTRLTGPYRSFLNKPVARFLQFGELYALSMVERTLEAVQFHKTGGNVDELDVSPAIKREIKKLDNKSQLPASKGRATQPFLRINPYKGDLELVLPSVSNVDNSFSWYVDNPNGLETLFPNFNFQLGRIESCTWNLNFPALELRVRDNSSNVESKIQVVSDTQPYLFFDLSGRNEKIRSELAPKKYWLLTSSVIHSDSAAVLKREFQAPIGWNNWNLYEIDLLNQSEFKLSDRAFKVRQISMPNLEGEALPNYVDIDGLTVYSSDVVLNLPRDIDVRVWRIQLVNLSSGDVHVLDRLQENSSHSLRIPLEGKPGAYEIRARGPWGRDLNEKFGYAKDLEIECNPSFRTLIDAQLEPCSIKVRGGLSEDKTVSLSSQESFLEHSIYGTTIKITPPAIAMSTRFDGIPNPWQSKYLEIKDTDLEFKIELVLRWPGIKYAKLHLLDIDEPNSPRDVNTVVDRSRIRYTIEQNKVEHTGIATFGLNGAKATVKEYPRLKIGLEFSGNLHVLGEISPAKLAENLFVQNDQLVVQSRQNLELLVTLWALDKPWQSPIMLKLPRRVNQVTLPEEFKECDFFCATVDIYSEVKEFFGPSKDIPNNKIILGRSSDEKHVSYSKILKNFKLQPAPSAETYWLALNFLARLEIRFSDPGFDFIYQIIENYEVPSHQNVEELMRLNLSEIEIIELLAVSRLLDQKLDSVKTQKRNSAWFKAISFDMEYDQSELQEMLVELIEICGSAAVGFLSRGKLELPDTEKMTEINCRYITLPSAQRIAIRKLLAIVPAKPLDFTGRSVAVEMVLSTLANRYEESRSYANLSYPISLLERHLQDYAPFVVEILKYVQVSRELMNKFCPIDVNKAQLIHGNLIKVPKFSRAAMMYLRGVAWSQIPKLPEDAHNQIERIVAEMWREVAIICATDFLLAELTCIRKYLVDNNVDLGFLENIERVVSDEAN